MAEAPTIPALVECAAERFGSSEALVDGDAAGADGRDVRRLTFGELAAATDEAARAYIAHGLEPGDRVAIWAPNSARWVVAALGAYRAGGVVTTVNRAAARMLGLQPEDVVGRPYAVAFAAPPYADLVALMQRIDRLREGSLERELQVPREGKSLTLLASLTALQGPEQEYLGIVLVFDDLTELLDAQRLAAWREVAQRIAHEIKNPLTPIQLSAQRLRRRLGGRLPDDGGILEECTGTIIGEVEGLRRLVDEFSRFARMPSLAPKAIDLHRLLDGVIALYSETHPTVALRSDFAHDVPVVEADGDQLKRALLNLIDNAVEAGASEVIVATGFNRVAGRLQIVVADNGPGVLADVREKVFLPYFSTKATGMGLGLPIVHQIVTDHGGHIRVDDNPPRGSRFIIDLPVIRPENGGGQHEEPRAVDVAPASRPAPQG